MLNMKAPLTTPLMLCLLASPLFSPSCAFTSSPFFGRAGPRRGGSSWTSRSSPRCQSSLSRPSSRWAPSCSSSPRDEGGDDSFSFADLQRELNRRQTDSQQHSPPPGVEGREAFMEEQMLLRKTLVQAYVLVYNQGQPEEGVYTLFVEGRNVLRAWENKLEATRYALMLTAEDLPLGTPTELPMTQIIGFCKGHGVGLELVARGRGLHPPSNNRANKDFDCPPPERKGRPSAGSSGSSRREKPLFTPQDLARIKSQFEESLEGDEEA